MFNRIALFTLLSTAPLWCTPIPAGSCNGGGTLAEFWSMYNGMSSGGGVCVQFGFEFKSAFTGYNVTDDESIHVSFYEVSGDPYSIGIIYTGTTTIRKSFGVALAPIGTTIFPPIGVPTMFTNRIISSTNPDIQAAYWYLYNPSSTGEFTVNTILTTTPEPSTWGLMAVGLVALAYRSRRSSREAGPRQECLRRAGSGMIVSPGPVVALTDEDHYAA